MDGETVGLIGGIAGAVLGTAGGVFGTWCSIRNTRGPRERAFMIRAAAWTWAGVIVFLAGLLLLPNPYRFLMWIPYGIALPLGIRFMNRRQQEVREAETGGD